MCASPPTMISAQDLQDLVDAQKPIQPTGRALAFLCVTIVFLISSTLCVALRVWFRFWKKRESRIWGWDDVFAILGQVLPKDPLLLKYQTHLFLPGWFYQPLCHRHFNALLWYWYACTLHRSPGRALMDVLSFQILFAMLKFAFLNSLFIGQKINPFPTTQNRPLLYHIQWSVLFHFVFHQDFHRHCHSSNLDFSTLQLHNLCMPLRCKCIFDNFICLVSSAMCAGGGSMESSLGNLQGRQPATSDLYN